MLSRKALSVGALFVLVSLASTVLTQSVALGVLDHLAAQEEATTAQLDQVREQLQ